METVGRHAGKRMTILRLDSTDYTEVDESTVLPPLTGAVHSGFVQQGKFMRRTTWPK